MGLRAKVIFGLILFFVIFGLKFLCANCQQVVPDVIVEDKIQPQMWHSIPTELAVNGDASEFSGLHDGTQTWTSENFVHRRRRPGARKRRRRPQGLQTTEMNELNNYWHGHVEDEALTDSVVLTIGKTKNYQTSTEPNAEGRQKPSNNFFVRPTNRVERIREPLAALEQEQRLSELRTKQRKIFTTEASAVSFRDKSYRKPYSQAKRQGETSTANPNRSGTDLKDILKNSGGLSLSEILQQKNLSLDDLIKGKQNALLALQTPATPVGSSANRLPKPVRRIPMSYLSTASPHVDSSTPEISESIFSTLDNDLNSSIANENSSAEILTDDNELIITTTLPENPALKPLASKPFEGVRRIRPSPTSQSIQDKKEFEKEVIYHVFENHVTSTKSPVSTYPTRVNYRKRLTIKPTYKITTEESFSSSVNEKDTQQTLQTQSSSQVSVEEKIRQTEPETNIIEKFATFEEAKLKDVATIEELFSDAFEQDSNSPTAQNITPRIDGFTRKSFTKIKPDVTESNPSLFTDFEQTVDDRTDLLELLEDRRSGGRLHKILAQRNMTLDELIQHRQRGSSQLHLSEIVHNKTGSIKAFSIRPQVLDEKLDIVTAFDNFPHFNLGNLKSIKPDEIKTDSQGSSYFTSIIDIKPTDEIHKDSRAMKSIKISADPVEPLPTSFLTSGEDKSIDFYSQPWKMFALPVSYSSRENNYIDQPAEVSAAQVAPPADVDTYDPTAQIEDEVARAHDLLDLELSGHGFRRSPVTMDSAELPVGVRSAIIASALIVIISLVIFLVIFAVCRWKQKHRKKLNYAENYNAIKTRLPVISRQSTMKKINPIASPIIFPGSKNNRINTMDPNSPEVQEYLFDTMRKPF